MGSHLIRLEVNLLLRKAVQDVHVLLLRVLLRLLLPGLAIQHESFLLLIWIIKLGVFGFVLREKRFQSF
jgi:hypothetical protein